MTIHTPSHHLTGVHITLRGLPLLDRTLCYPRRNNSYHGHPRRVDSSPGCHLCRVCTTLRYPRRVHLIRCYPRRTVCNTLRYPRRVNPILRYPRIVDPTLRYPRRIDLQLGIVY